MGYTRKTLGIYWNLFLMRINKVFLKTYQSNEDCARCRDCGRTVHDFNVEDELWLAVMSSDTGVWCWDCFAERARNKGVSCQSDVRRTR